jgi:hypothetical protein
MKTKKQSHILWSSNMSAKDYICAKDIEWKNDLQTERNINFKYKIEK